LKQKLLRELSGNYFEGRKTGESLVTKTVHSQSSCRCGSTLRGAALMFLPLILIAARAGAQSAATPPAASAAGDSLTEIVVTAARREETLQKTSLAIVAATGAEVREAGVVQVTDLSKLVLGINVGMNGGSSQIFVRGVGDASANALSNPGVAFNVDGVYVGRPEAVNSNFFDVSRLEVLKGPQGTLYGRNSSGGAINLITNSPTFDGVNGTLNVESGNYNLFRVDGAVNVPITDTLAMRFAFNKVSRDGYLSDGTNDDHEQAFRWKTLWRPSDAVSLAFNVDGADVTGKGPGYVYIPRLPGQSPWDADSSARSNAYLASFPSSAGVNPQGQDSSIDNKFLDVSAQLDWDLGFATMTIIPAYRHGNTYDLDYDAQLQQISDKSNQETFEARLSHSGDIVKWVAGLYYFHEANPGQVHIDVGPTVLFTRIEYVPSGHSEAAFGETTFTVAEGFRLIAGARVTTEHRALNGIFFTSPDNGATYVDHENFNGGVTFNAVTWKAGAEYDLTPHNMLYATASTGFKAGGLTQTTSPDNVYQPEKVLAYELGSRNRFLDDTLQLNLEAFRWTYKDQQQSFLTFDDTGSVNFLTENAGAATLYGFNVDLIDKVTRHDTVRLSTEYDHSRYSDFVINQPAIFFNPAATECKNVGTIPGPVLPLAQIDCSGFALPHAPEWTGLADYSHAFDLPNGDSIVLDANARFSSWTWLSANFVAEERAPSFHVFNAEATYLTGGGKWSVTGYVRNISNATEYTGGTISAQVPQIFAANINPPRTYGVQLHLSF
jgi:iron complex outermembrane recepter protein